MRIETVHEDPPTEACARVKYDTGFRGESVAFTVEVTDRATQSDGDSDDHPRRILLDTVPGQDMAGTIVVNVARDVLQLDGVRVAVYEEISPRRMRWTMKRKQTKHWESVIDAE